MLLCGRDPRLIPPPLGRLCSAHFDPSATLERIRRGPCGGTVPQVGHEWDFALQRVRLVCSPTLRRNTFWTSLRDFYHAGLFCDVDIVCKNQGEEGGGSVSCHRLVLASLSSFQEAFQTTDAEGERAVVYLLDANVDDVKRAISALYDFLAGQMSPEDFQEADVAGVFPSLGIDAGGVGAQSETEAPLPIISKVCVKVERDNDAEMVAKVERDEEDMEEDAGDFQNDFTPADEDYEFGTVEETVELTEKEKPQKINKKPLQRSDVRNITAGAHDPTAPFPKNLLAEVAAAEKATEFRRQLELCRNEKELIEAEMMGVGHVMPMHHTSAAKRRACHVMAIVAAKRTEEENTVLAWPLAWNPAPKPETGEPDLSTELVQSYLKSFIKAAQKVYGLSETECYYQTSIFVRTGASNESRRGKLKYNLERTYRTYDDEALKNLLTEEVVQANKKGECKPFIANELAKDGWTKKIKVKLTDESGMADPDGLLLLVCENQGGIAAKGFKVEEETRTDDIAKLYQAFFDILLVGTKPTEDMVTKQGTVKRGYAPRVEALYQEYFRVERLAVVHQVSRII